MIYRFDGYELDLQRYELRSTGHVVKLEPQVFAVLVYLIQHRDRVVTKDELVKHVWTGRLVSEATLTSRVMAARRAVGDRGREQRVIQTLHGRGYRFIAAVEERTVDSSMPEAAGRVYPQGHLTAVPGLLGTCRPEAIKASSHPLQGMIQDLRLRQHCQELALSALSATEVEAYLAARLMNKALAATLGPTLHRCTEGNPLFMVNLLEHWMAHGWLSQQCEEWTLRSGWEAIAREIPSTLREVVTQRQARLNLTEQRLLEVASVSGLEFSAASVAAGMAAEVVETETWCEALARRGEFLQACGVEAWADGTVATCYRFRHALYQDIIYERIPAARQAQIHRRIGTREEAGYGERCGEIAARLAMHFERGHELARAVRYHHQAPQQAMQRSGYQEAIGHLSRGLDLLQQLPENPQRAEQELIMQLALGSALKVTKGFAAAAAEAAYLRARELCHQLGEPPQLFPALYSLYELYEFRGAFQQARALGEQLLHLASRWHDAALILGAHEILACTTFHLGAFTRVLEHMERGPTLYDPQQHRTLAALYGKDLGVACRYWSAMALWFLGYPDQALQKIHEAMTLAQDPAHPYSMAMALDRAAFLG